MGTSSSKTNPENYFQQRSNSVRQSSQKRRSSQSKSDQIDDISKVIGNLKNEIDIFAGNRTDSRYKEFQKILTTLAANLQKMKNGSKKQQYLERCDEILGEIQNCLQRLETRVNFNEQNENSLDLASVESHSFINVNQRPPPPALLNKKWAEELPPPTKQKQPKFDFFKSLEHLEQQTQNLEREIKFAIETEDTKQFIIYEKKIKLLYTDLELVRVDDHTPLSEKKAGIGKRLIKCNNQIKRFKKKAAAKDTTQDGPKFSKPANQKKDENPVDDFTKMEHLLGDLEIQALTFEGVKGDARYKELEQILESHWTRLYSMDAFGEEERKRRSITVERTKIILQELLKRAEENERQLSAIKSINKIEQQLQSVKKEAKVFTGTTQDPAYIKLDQDLRSLWANLSEVKEPNEHIRRSKARVTNDIQYALKELSEGTKNRKIYANAAFIKNTEAELTTERSLPADDAIDDEILQKQLLKQVREFQNQWNQLNYNLDVQKISKSETSISIIDILEKVLEGVNTKKHALSIIEKRKSNSSLVIAKVIDNTDMLTKIQPTFFKKPAAATTVTDTENYYENQKMFTTFKPTTSATTFQSRYHPPDLIQQQPISPPISKPIETEIKVQPMVKTIGEIQRVGTEAKSLLQQIRQSTCTKNDSEYQHFEAKLQQCQLKLQSIEYPKRSDTIESNRRRASKTINEAFRVLEEKAPSKSILEQDKAAATRSSRAQEIMDIDAGIQYFRQQIKNFTGVTKDQQYEKIKQGLTDSLSKLQVIDDVHMSKQESIRQIQQYHQELETKLAENQAKVKLAEKNAKIRRQANQDIKDIVEQVQKLRSQVERFSGAYDGLHYKQIEDNLGNCLEKIEGVDSRSDEKLQSAKLQTKQKIQKYLRILEDKSTKSSTQHVSEDQATPESQPYQEHIEKQEVQHLKSYSVSVEQQHNSVTQQQPSSIKDERYQIDNSTVTPPDVVHRKKIQRQSQITDSDSPHQKINSLRDKLVEIKTKTETFSGNYKDGEYSEIENQLLGFSEELKGIDDRGHMSVIISKEQYADYIEKLLGYFEEKTKVSEAYSEEKSDKKVQLTTETEEAKTSNNMPITQPAQKFTVIDPIEELAVIEDKILKLKSKVDSFEGSANEVLYTDLEQSLSSHMVKLESIQAGNVAHVRERKRKLVQELENCTRLLIDKAKSWQEMSSEKYQEQLEKINSVLNELEEISKEVNDFVGVKNDREYCYLDELLIKLTIQLDNTETYGQSELRNARKKAIREIQNNMDILGKRALPKENIGVGVINASQV